MQAATSYVVIVGTPGKDALTLVGPFETSEEAGEWRVANEHPSIESMVDVLLHPTETVPTTTSEPQA